MTHPTTVSPLFPFLEDPFSLQNLRSSFVLDPAQIGRLETLLSTQFVLQPKKEFQQEFCSVERGMGELLSHLLSLTANGELYLIGGAAGHIVSGNQSYSDIDFALFEEQDPQKSYQTFKTYMVDLVQNWVNSARSPRKKALSSQEVFDVYFYKSSDRHLCLSFGNVDVKILVPGARTHLFDDDSLAVELRPGPLNNCSISLVPEALNPDLEHVLELSRYKILNLSQPETAYGFHFRVFKKFSQGYLVPQELIDLALHHLQQSFLQNSHFKESLRFFCLNHLERVNVLNFKLNLHNALFFCKDIPESAAEVILAAIDEELDPFLGYFPHAVAWDPYKELLSVLSSALLNSPEKLVIKKNAFALLNHQFFLPKSFAASVEDICHFLPQDPQTSLKVFSNALLLYAAEPGISAEKVETFFEKLYELYLEKYPLTGEQQAEWEKIRKNHRLPPLSQKDPLDYLKNLNKTHLLTQEVFHQLMPICILKGRYSEEELKQFLFEFPPDKALEEKRMFLRKFTLDPIQRPTFLVMEHLLRKFFGGNLYEEFLDLYPKTFFDQCSRFIEDDVLYVEEKLPLLNWIESRGLFSNLSWKALERYEIYALSMPMTKAVGLFFRKGLTTRFFPWIQDAYDHSPNKDRFFGDLKSEALNTKDLLPFTLLILSLETRQPFSIDGLEALSTQSLSPLAKEAFSFLRIYHFSENRSEEELIADLSVLSQDEVFLLKRPLYAYLVKAAHEEKPVCPCILGSLFKDLQLETVLAEISDEHQDLAADRVLYFLKDKIEYPHPKNRDLIPLGLRFLKKCPSILQKDPDCRLVENLSRVLQEGQLLELKGQLEESAYFTLILKRGLKTKFSGSLELKKEFLQAYLKVADEGFEVAEIFSMVEELTLRYDQKPPTIPFLSAYGSRSKKQALEVFELVARLDSCPLEMHQFLEVLLKKYPDLKFSHEVKLKLRALFQGQRLACFFEAFELFNSLKEGLEVLKNSPADLLRKDPRVLKTLLECLDEKAEKGEIEALLLHLSSNLLSSQDCNLGALLAKLLEKKELFSPKSENLYLQILVGLLEKDFDAAVRLFQESGDFFPFLDANLMQISKVPIRLAVFKTLLMRKDFSFDPRHAVVLNAFLNRKNSEIFFRDFVEDKILAKCFALCQKAISPEECFKSFYPILSHHAILEKVRTETVAQGLLAIFPLKEFNQLPLSNQIDLYMLFEKTHNELEATLFRGLLENREWTTVNPSQVSWLVDHFFALETEGVALANVGVQFLESFLFSRENLPTVLKVLESLTHQVHLTDAEAERLAILVMRQELTHPDLVDAMTKFLDRYEATLFFPALSKSRDLAFLYLLSQRAPSVGIYEKMQSRIGVYLQDLNGLKGECLERITDKIVASYAANLGSKPIEEKKELFCALLAPIAKKRCYSASWLKIYLEDLDLVFPKKERLLSFKEDVADLNPLQISSLLQWKCHLFKNKMENQSDTFSGLEILRKCFLMNEQEGFSRSKQKKEIVSTLLETFPLEGPSLVAIYEKYQDGLNHPECSHFYLDTLFADICKGMDCLKKLFLKATNEQERLKITETLAICLDNYVVLTQYDTNTLKLDFKVVNSILRDFLGELDVDRYFKIVDRVFNSFVDFLRIFPEEFDAQKDELDPFFKIFVRQLFYKRLGDPEILKDFFRFFGNAARLKNVYLVHIAADLIGSFFSSSMDPQTILMQKEMIQAQGDIFSIAYESTIRCLLDFYDKNLYNKARFTYEQYKLVFQKGLPLLDQRFSTDLIYYDLEVKDCKKILKTYSKLFEKKGEGRERLHFMQRVAGRALSLLDHENGWKNREFVEAISLFYETHSTRLLEDKNLLHEVGLEVSHTVMFLYGSLLSSLMDNSLKASMKEEENKKALLKATEICFLKVKELIRMLPMLFTPSLSPLFSKIFPNLEKMLDIQFTFSEKDPDIAQQKSWVRTQFLDLMLQAIATFDTSRVEIMDITKLLYSYFRLLDREIMGAKTPAQGRLYMLEKCRALVGCGLHDIANQALQSKEEIVFFIEHFLENLDSIPSLEENRKNKILTQFDVWIQQVVKKRLVKANRDKLEPHLGKIAARIGKDR